MRGEEDRAAQHAGVRVGEREEARVRGRRRCAEERVEAREVRERDVVLDDDDCAGGL